MNQKSHKRALILYCMYVSYYVREDVYCVFHLGGPGPHCVVMMFILIKYTVST
jgi:hypothetical protein